ncbi:MAG: hypothetical protein HY817_03490 [Candidatus Abawacabacteria bacterium]|nr:hypothetical protein [Candidatus Abawacabacteria bacterium]
MKKNSKSWLAVEDTAHAYSHHLFSRRQARGYLDSMIASSSLTILATTDTAALWSRTLADIDKGRFPRNTFKYLQSLDAAKQEVWRQKVNAVLLKKDLLGERDEIIPVEILLYLLSKARAPHWLPVDNLQTKKQGIDVQELLEVLPQWGLSAAVTQRYTPHEICVKLADIARLPQMKDALLTEVSEKRAWLRRVFPPTTTPTTVQLLT